MNFDILKRNNLLISKVLDVGAHSGTFTLSCKEYYPDAYYYMIDGNPLSDEHLRKLDIDYKIVYLSDVVKDAVVYKTTHNEFNTGDSLFRENSSYYSDDKIFTENIKTSTLDEIFMNQVTFDFIKIDCQGSEMDIIKGGLDMCKRAQVFLLEVSVWPYNNNAPMFDEMKEFMSSIGFKHTMIVSDLFHPDDHNLLIQHDVLFSKVDLN